MHKKIGKIFLYMPLISCSYSMEKDIICEKNPNIILDQIHQCFVDHHNKSQTFLEIILNNNLGDHKNYKTSNGETYTAYKKRTEKFNQNYPEYALPYVRENSFVETPILKKHHDIRYYPEKILIFYNQLDINNLKKIENEHLILPMALIRDYIAKIYSYSFLTQKRSTQEHIEEMNSIFGIIHEYLITLKEFVTDDNNYNKDLFLGSYKKDGIKSFTENMNSLISPLNSTLEDIKKTYNSDYFETFYQLVSSNKNYVNQLCVLLLALARRIEATKLITMPSFLLLEKIFNKTVIDYIKDTQKVYIDVAIKIKKTYPNNINEENIMEILTTWRKNKIINPEDLIHKNGQQITNKLLSVLYTNRAVYVPIILTNNDTKKIFLTWVSGPLLQDIFSNPKCHEEWKKLINDDTNNTKDLTFEQITSSLIVMSMALFNLAPDFMESKIQANSDSQLFFKSIEHMVSKKKIFYTEKALNDEIYKTENLVSITLAEKAAKEDKLLFQLKSNNDNFSFNLPYKECSHIERFNILPVFTKILETKN